MGSIKQEYEYFACLLVHGKIVQHLTREGYYALNIKKEEAERILKFLQYSLNKDKEETRI